jgi:hypothetical protein
MLIPNSLIRVQNKNIEKKVQNPKNLKFAEFLAFNCIPNHFLKSLRTNMDSQISNAYAQKQNISRHFSKK